MKIIRKDSGKIRVFVQVRDIKFLLDNFNPCSLDHFYYIALLDKYSECVLKRLSFDDFIFVDDEALAIFLERCDLVLDYDEYINYDIMGLNKIISNRGLISNFTLGKAIFEYQNDSLKWLLDCQTGSTKIKIPLIENERFIYQRNGVRVYATDLKNYFLLKSDDSLNVWDDFDMDFVVSALKEARKYGLCDEFLEENINLSYDEFANRIVISLALPLKKEEKSKFSLLNKLKSNKKNLS